MIGSSGTLDHTIIVRLSPAEHTESDTLVHWHTMVGHAVWRTSVYRATVQDAALVVNGPPSPLTHRCVAR